jgi:hypothetical protein
VEEVGELRASGIARAVRVGVPESVVGEWKRMPMADDRTVAALTTANLK